MSEDKYNTGNVNDDNTRDDNKNNQEEVADADPDDINIKQTDEYADTSKLPDPTELSDTAELADATANAAAIRIKKIRKYKIISTIFSISFILFTALFINEVVIQPYRSNKAIEKTNRLYQNSEEALNDAFLSEGAPTTDAKLNEEQFPDQSENGNSIVIKDPKRDDKGRLLQFTDLLAVNEDVKGWITIPDTNIDYVVVQSSNEDPEYYLKRNIFKEDDKAGSLFLDVRSSVEDKTQNLVIHGHNMYSSDNMFHYITEYKKLDFYKARPTFTFDTIYQTGKWKIFSVFITNGTSRKEDLFDYTRTDFTSSSDFLNFIYQLRIRSMYFIDDVTINENDELLILSTCSYEVKDYRTVVVARKLREGEDETVDVDSVTENLAPLLPWSWYYRYGGKAPKITNTFEVALDAGEINWYKPLGE